MSISSEITRIQNKRDQSFTEVANKGVTVPAGSTIDDLPGLIAQIEQGSGSGSGGIIYQDLDGYLNLSEEEANVISIVDTLDTAGGTVRTITGAVESGGGGVEEAPLNDVNFIDYDGTIVASYSASDFANLSALPANPTHTGLTAQGWNWTLNNAKTYVGKYGRLEIGQMYVTDDGKTRLYCRFEQGRLAPYLGIGVNGTVIVDWGDNTATDTLTGTTITTAVHTNHVYAAPGNYVITLSVSSGKFAIFGVSNTSHILKKDTSTTSNIHRVYTDTIKKIELGSNVVVGEYAFRYCSSLTSLTVPASTSIGGYAFYQCYALASIAIPTSMTSIGSYTFTYCYGLKSIQIPNSITSFEGNMLSSCFSVTSITIPTSVTSIGNAAFSGCSSLASITIPDGVTSLAASAFSNCYGLGEIHFTMSTPPTVANSNAFQNLSTDCIIYVPSGSLSAYTSATNYPSSSTYTYMEE